MMSVDISRFRPVVEQSKQVTQRMLLMWITRETQSSSSDDPEEEVTSESVRNSASNNAEHSKASIEFLGYFVVGDAPGVVCVGHCGLFGPHVLLFAIVGGYSHYHSRFTMRA